MPKDAPVSEPLYSTILSDPLILLTSVSCFLLVVGLLGGGFHFIIRVPKLDKNARVACVTFGSVLLVYLYVLPKPPFPPINPNRAPATTSTPIPTATITPIPKPQTESVEQAESVEREVVAQYKRWCAAWHMHDSAHLLDFYDAGAKIYNGISSTYRGKSKFANEIKAEWAKEEGEGISVWVTPLSQIKVDVQGKRVTLVYLQRFKSLQHNRILTDTTDQQTLVWEKSGGEWLITEQSRQIPQHIAG